MNCRTLISYLLKFSTRRLFKIFLKISQTSNYIKIRCISQRQLVFISPGWHIELPNYLCEKKTFFSRDQEKYKSNSLDFSCFFFLQTVFFPRTRWWAPTSTYLLDFVFPTYRAEKNGATYLFLRNMLKNDVPPWKNKNQLPLYQHIQPSIW